MEQIKGQKIKNVYIKYTFKIVLVIALITALNVLLNIVLIQSPLVYSGADQENNVFSNIKSLEDEKIDPKTILLPTNTYGIYDEEGKYLEGNLKNEKNIYNIYKSGKNSAGSNTFVKEISRGDNTLLVTFSDKAAFKNATIRRYIPRTEYVFLGLAVIEIIILMIIMANKNSKKLTESVEQLNEILVNLTKENLDFMIKETKIYEVNEVLGEISVMQTSLQSGIDKLVKKEQENEQRIEFLTEEIRGPLKIIKGQTEILLEGDRAHQEYLRNIYEYTIQVQKNVQDLKKATKIMNMPKMSNLSKLQQTQEILDEEVEEKEETDEVTLAKFFSKFLHQAKELSNKYNIELSILNELTGNRKIMINEAKLDRALLNVFISSIERAKNKVEIHTAVEDGQIEFFVQSDGKEFTSSEIANTSNIVDVNDKSKNIDSYTKIGIKYAADAIKEFNGTLALKNKRNGSCIEIKIPLNQEIE